MNKINITLPEFSPHEAQEIHRMLRREGICRVHIRKPDATENQVRTLIEEISPELRPQITLHDHFNLAVEYSLGGVHLNSRNPEPPKRWHGLVSRSLHTVQELANFKEDYAFLSPIYPSISKPGYSGDFNLAALQPLLKECRNVYALGGVTPAKFAEIENAGFAGAVMLGAAWRPYVDEDSFRLQFITHASKRYSTYTGALEALRGGCQWIQLRMKNAGFADISVVGWRLAQLCRDYGATFLIDDHVEMVDILNADGVHLGKNDMPVAQARQILGPRRIIGATANTFDDVKAAYEAGADYVGLGPFRFTTTKEKLSPVLGMEGYNDILERCRRKGIDIPIVAIGGITREDIPQIIATGVKGVAVSGDILNARDPAERTSDLLSRIETSF